MHNLNSAAYHCACVLLPAVTPRQDILCPGPGPGHKPASGAACRQDPIRSPLISVQSFYLELIHAAGHCTKSHSCMSLECCECRYVMEAGNVTQYSLNISFSKQHTTHSVYSMLRILNSQHFQQQMTCSWPENIVQIAIFLLSFVTTPTISFGRNGHNGCALPQLLSYSYSFTT